LIKKIVESEKEEVEFNKSSGVKINAADSKSNSSGKKENSKCCK
jgi:hypothetical protein